MSQNLEYVASNIHHFSDFEGILKYSQSFDIFWGQTTRRNLKLLIFCESWIVCIAETYSFIFCFDCNISRNMTSDTSLFRVLLHKSKHTQFSYTCVGCINRCQTNILHVLLLKKFRVCRTFFCSFNFWPKILNTLHQTCTTFQILREYSNIDKASTFFDRRNHSEET